MLLSNLKNTRKVRRKKRVGRGPGSGKGKTCARGISGYKARSGSKKRYGYEGGQMRLFTKLPKKGFSRGKFIKPILELNFCQIEELYKEGDIVNIQTLRDKGLLPKNINKVKILSKGELKKNKIQIEAHSFSKGALQKLDEKKIKYTKVK